ncbi:hypothetical protein JB92DRAFT_185606 [Gautieria morchelliformis]|nr:hypothetical protein JB92DRAFT_185606 [Gautieria morchelliformis]
MSDLMSQRGSLDGRDSASGVHPRAGSAYSGGGGGTAGGSTGSGGGRVSPTTSSSLFAVQSQIQALKEKHDTQTEALLAALADSQRTCRDLKDENEALKRQMMSLEDRLIEAISTSRQKEKELSRALRRKPVSPPDRTRTMVSPRDTEFSLKSHPPPRPSTRSTPSPTRRRPSTSSSVFPAMPGSMSLLMAETPGSPPDDSFGSGSGSSPPHSPTLVLPSAAPKQKSPERRKPNGDHDMPMPSSPQPITNSHKRSTSGASEATSTNFSFETGSPGSLKLKPEHELLLGDMTRLSLVTGFDGDSEAET